MLAYLVLLDRLGNPRTVEVGKEAVYTARGLWRPSAEHADEWERLTSRLRLEPFYEKSPACVEWKEAVERDNDYDLLSTASATLCLTRRSIVQPPEHLDAGLVTAIATGFEEKATLTEEWQEAVANGDDPAKIGCSHVWLVLTDAAGRKTRPR